jgi:putative transcriptional regulator
MIKYHPTPELLLDYASGSMSEGPALAVAGHAWHCARCRRSVADLDAIGGMLLEDVAPAEVDARVFDAVMSRIGSDVAAEPSWTRSLDAETMRVIPEPLWRLLPGRLADIAWRRVGRLFEEVRLPLAKKGVNASLMRFKAGSLMPKHSHRGHEYTLVLAGGFTDGSATYGPGDFTSHDSTVMHQPRVDDDEDCLCLVVLDAPIKLTGFVGRLVNPFLRI